MIMTYSLNWSVTELGKYYEKLAEKDLFNLGSIRQRYTSAGVLITFYIKVVSYDTFATIKSVIL